MRSWSARVSLLGRFTVMGVIVVAALGLAIVHVLQKQIERRALDHAVHSAQVIGNLGVRSSLDRGDMRFPISLKRLKLLDRHGVEGDRLECEISEHTVMADPLRASEVLERLRALGVRLSLDDFGTGHSSLAYLKRLPLDEVKIDRSFVSGMADDENDMVIVRSTIDLARNLGLAVVAEGVESAEIMDELTALRCDTAQGFHLSRPLPAAELNDWLAARV